MEFRISVCFISPGLAELSDLEGIFDFQIIAFD